MMSDLDVLQELINEEALVPLEKTYYGKKTVVLGEYDQQGRFRYSIRIKGVPSDAVVVKTDNFPPPKGIFACRNGECKRADYVIIADSEIGNFIIHIEMKKNIDNAGDIINQLKGSECFISYCQSIVHRFWQRSDFLDPYESRFVSFRKIRTGKAPTREESRSTELHDAPEKMFRISDVKDGGKVHFRRLIQGGSHR